MTFLYQKKSWPVVTLTFAIAFIFNANFILTHFFLQAPYLMDSGWFAGLLHHPSFNLGNPQSINNLSYYNTHFSPILFFFGLPSWVLPFNPPTYFAIFEGFVYGMVGAAAALTAWENLPYTKIRSLISISIGLSLAFSGITFSAIGYPHFEPLYAALALLTLHAIFSDHKKRLIILLPLLLIVREDAALHLGGFIALLWLLAWVSPTLKPHRRCLLIVGLLSAAYAGLVICIQKHFFPSDDALTRIYLGHPIYAHLTRDFLTQRLDTITHESLFIITPIGLLAVASIILRSSILMIGILAILPWTLLNFFAISPAAGSLSLYYSFPLIVMLGWPCVAYRVENATNRHWLPWIQLGMCLLSLGFFSYQHTSASNALWKDSARLPLSSQGYAKSAEIIKSLVQNSAGFYADASTAALFPKLIPQNKILKPITQQPSDLKMWLINTGNENLISMLEDSYKYDLRYLYALPLSNLKILASEPRNDLPTATTSILSSLSVAPKAMRNQSGYVTLKSADPEPTIVCFGPYINLPPGRYTINYKISMNTNDICLLISEITNHQSSGIINLHHQSIAAGFTETINSSLEFRTSENTGPIEFRVWLGGKGTITLQKVELLKSEIR